MVFLSTPSARRATFDGTICTNAYPFLSTPSARRATSPIALVLVAYSDFYPRPPRGGRPFSKLLKVDFTEISIHALREEGDVCCFQLLVYQTTFLSTPSARRATRLLIATRCFLSDFYPRPPRGGRPGIPNIIREQIRNFYPRPPRGGRRGKVRPHYDSRRISIHALREEGDCKNGEKHLRFCFIIKRSAQIWKSLSKNIRKNSRDLHRTA